MSIENFEGRPTDLSRASPKGETEEISPEADRPERTVKIGADMGEHVKVNLISLLRSIVDVFAFSADEMSGIDPAYIVNRLNVNKDVRSVKQKKRTSQLRRMHQLRKTWINY